MFVDDIPDSRLLQLLKSQQWQSAYTFLETSDGQGMVTSSDSHGNMPLHVAIGYQAPEELVLRILYMHPAAAMVRGADDWLPLHVAARWGVSSRVLEELIRAYPQALDDQGQGGIKGRTPRYFASRFPHNKELLERSTQEWIRLVEKGIRTAELSPWEANKRMRLGR